MKPNTLLFIMVLLSIFSFGQNYQPGKLWVSATSLSARAVNDSLTASAELNAIFRDYNVYSYEQVMGFAKTPSLRDIYEINCQCNESALKQTLLSNAPEYFSFVELIPEMVYIYDPEDGFWKYNRHWIWHLPKIKADSAWDYTIGNSQIKIGIIDAGVDIEHPDLETQVYPHYDPYNKNPFSSLQLFESGRWHGTTVASFAAARTAETGTNPTPNGELASYQTTGIKRALHASTVMGCDVINNSWMSLGSITPGLDSIYNDAVNEILNNGTVIVVAAGNGYCTTWYNDDENWTNCDSIPPDFQYFSPSYPFHPKYDSTIIIVTSTDSLDNHTLYGDTVINRTHSHFPQVDICSPGHYVMGSALTYTVDTLTGDTVKSSWPYYGSFGGTSFATPIVSGVCALIKSINPCLTPAQVEQILKLTADTVADANLYPGMLGAGRINAYQAVKYTQENYGYEEYIIENEEDITWTTEHRAKKIIIESGGKLTVKSLVYMLPEGDVIIHQGGNLVVDSGYLTTCKGLWNGIQVWGDRTLDQYSFNNQGHLTLKNNATIENAKSGVTLAISDGLKINPLKTGGIIQATDANFINCVTGVSFYPYENFLYDTNNIKNNLSYLKNCTFMLDSNYHHVFFGPKQFIFMEDIRGLAINGCVFLNEIQSKDFEDVTEIDPDEMVGIRSINSAFLVDELCLTEEYPCDSVRPSRFEKLKYGIYALNYGGEKYPRIEQSEFYKNMTGIYLGTINNAVVNQNYFYSEPVDTSGIGTNIMGGLYLDHCNAYEVQENRFISSNPIGTTGLKVGLVVNNSGPYPNEIYKNDFSYLDYGILALNQNKLDTVGLCIKCNDFLHCDFDVSVVVDTAVRGWGIAEYQGSRDDTTTAPAGNVFSDFFAQHEFDLYNDELADPFTYFHHDETQTPSINVEPDYYSESVSLSQTPQVYDSAVSCPSRIGGGGNPSEEKSKIDDANNQVASIESSLSLLIDGGNTPSLTQEVAYSTPPEALDLTTQLLSESPFLSDTVMKSAIGKEDVLTNAMLRDVLVENPQAAKSVEIMQMIDEKDDPMPEYMKEQIAQGKYTTGEKENLEARRNFYLTEHYRAFSHLNRFYQSDPGITYRLDSLVSVFTEVSSLESEYRKAFIHLEKGDTSMAWNLISAIPSSYSLTIEQSNTHQQYEDLFDILIELKVQRSSVMTLDSAQIAGLLNIYNDNTTPGIYARNILLTAGYLTYQEPYLFPDNLKKMEIKPMTAEAAWQTGSIRTYPNPATYYTIVSFDMGDDEMDHNPKETTSIVVRDIRGITLKILTSSQKKDQLVLDVRNFKPGLYFVDLLCQGQRMATTKLIVER